MVSIYQFLFVGTKYLVSKFNIQEYCLDVLYFLLKKKKVLIQIVCVLEQRIHPICSSLSTDDASHWWVPFRICFCRRYLHIDISSSWASQFPSTIPTDFLHLGVDFQYYAGGENEQIQRNSDVGWHSERLCQGKSYQNYLGCFQKFDWETWRLAGC